jgi:hypothetical protein
VEIIDAQGNIETSQLSGFVTGSDNLPPDAFEMIYPQHDEIDVTETLFKWEETTDPDGDNISYSIRVIKLPVEAGPPAFSKANILETQVELLLQIIKPAILRHRVYSSQV